MELIGSEYVSGLIMKCGTVDISMNYSDTIHAPRLIKSLLTEEHVQLQMRCDGRHSAVR